MVRHRRTIALKVHRLSKGNRRASFSKISERLDHKLPNRLFDSKNYVHHSQKRVKGSAIVFVLHTRACKTRHLLRCYCSKNVVVSNGIVISHRKWVSTLKSIKTTYRNFANVKNVLKLF